MKNRWVAPRLLLIVQLCKRTREYASFPSPCCKVISFFILKHFANILLVWKKIYWFVHSLLLLLSLQRVLITKNCPAKEITTKHDSLQWLANGKCTIKCLSCDPTDSFTSFMTLHESEFLKTSKTFYTNRLPGNYNFIFTHIGITLQYFWEKNKRENLVSIWRRKRKENFKPIFPSYAR